MSPEQVFADCKLCGTGPAAPAKMHSGKKAQPKQRCVLAAPLAVRDSRASSPGRDWAADTRAERSWGGEGRRAKAARLSDQDMGDGDEAAPGQNQRQYLRRIFSVVFAKEGLSLQLSD